MKDLSIIIKGGNKDKIYRTLYSIMCQSADWGKLKIIVHEASVPKSIKNIPLDYTVSETYRITTPFVMYFEAGDCFSANDSLWFIQRAIKENPEACTISTEFIEEAVNGNQASIQQFPNNTDAPYGKILSKRAAGKAGAENCEPVFVKQVTYIKRTEIEQKAIASPKLSIVIPYFKDDEKLLFRALASIETQSSINFHNIEVLVCIDTKGNTKVKRLIDKNPFSFKIDFFERSGPNSPGQNRQNGVNKAFGDFIMFLDCDDCLRDATTLAFILSQISTHKDTDLFRLGTFRELDDGSFTPIDCTNETWLHGKIVRRDFLRQNNIRFSEELMCNEDIYWNLRLSTFSPKTINIPTEVYFWRNNPDSLTRALGAEDFIARYFHEYIKARHYGLRDGKPMSDGTANRIIQTSVYSFVIINSSDMNKRPEFKALAEEAFRAFIKDYRYIFDQHNQPEKIEPYFLSMIQAHLGKLQYRISLFDWLDSITPKDYHKPEKAKKSK